MQHVKNRTTKTKVGLSLLAVAALFFTAGCSGDESAPSGDSSEGAAGGTLEKIQSSGELSIGVKYDTYPYGFIAEGESEPQGFDVDITAEIAKRLGAEPRYVEAGAENRIPYLQSGVVDLVAASMVHNRVRDESIDFSTTYLEDTNKFLVLSDSDLKGIDDLAGKTVTVTQGSTQQAAIESLAPDAKILAYQDWPSALQALLRGEAEAVVSTSGILAGLQRTANEAGEDVKIIGEGFDPSPIAMGVRENESDFRDAVDAALMAMHEDGTYDEISNKWWGDIFPEPYDMNTIPAG